MLAGGVHRSLPAGTRVILSGVVIRNRIAPNVSQEAQQILPERFGEQFRKYLRDKTELLDIVDHQAESRRSVEMPSSEWTRLHLIN